MDDLETNGDVEVNLDDDDDMFKSARALEPEPEKRDVNLFGDVSDDLDPVARNASPDIAVTEIHLEDDDEKPFEVNNPNKPQLHTFIFYSSIIKTDIQLCVTNNTLLHSPF